MTVDALPLLPSRVLYCHLHGWLARRVAVAQVWLMAAIMVAYVLAGCDPTGTPLETDPGIEPG